MLCNQRTNERKAEREARDRERDRERQRERDRFRDRDGYRDRGRYRSRSRSRERSRSFRRSRSSERHSSHARSESHDRRPLPPPMDDFPKKPTSATNSTDPELVNSRVFIGHLPTDRITKDELEEMFKKYGEILGESIWEMHGFHIHLKVDFIWWKLSLYH